LANLEIRKYTGYRCLVVNSSIAYDEAVELLLKERVLMYNKYYVTDDDQSWSIKDYGDMAIAHTTIISNPSENMYNVHLKNIRKHVSNAMFEMCKRFCDVFEIERVTFTPISQEEVLIQALPSPLRPFPHVYIMLTPTKYGHTLDINNKPDLIDHNGSFVDIYPPYCNKYNALRFPSWITKDITGYKVFSDAELLKKYGVQLTQQEIQNRAECRDKI
jgi:hypothetical protein